MRLEPDNGPVRQKLAELHLAGKDYAAAATLAFGGIHADVEDPASHALLAAALAGQGKHDEAVLEYEVALQLDGDQADWLAGLAQSLLALDKKDAAREAAQRLRKADRDHPALPDLEKRLAP